MNFGEQVVAAEVKIFIENAFLHEHDLKYFFELKFPASCSIKNFLKKLF